MVYDDGSNGLQSYNMSNIDNMADIFQYNKPTKIQFIFTKIDPYEFIKENFDLSDKTGGLVEIKKEEYDLV